MRLTEERLGVSVEDKVRRRSREGVVRERPVAVTGETKSDGLEEPKPRCTRAASAPSRWRTRVEKIWFGSIASEAAPRKTGSTSVRADVVKGNSEPA